MSCSSIHTKAHFEKHVIITTIISSLIQNHIELKKNIFGAFVDFNKAFDWVNRSLLFYKLRHDYNVTGNIYWAIKALYRETESCIRLNNEYSSWFKTTCGVRQGDSLSPTMFSLFINDLAHQINDLRCGVRFGDSSLSILMYADDVILLSENESDLQKMLNALSEWCKKWRLTVNETKTKIVHFRPKRTPLTTNVFTLNEKNIEIVSHYKYLGLQLQEFFDLNFTADFLANAGSRALGALRNKIYNVKDMKLGTFTKLFTTGITPILDYCSGVWGFNSYKSIEDVQRKASRYFLGVHKLCPIAALEGDIGWVTCSVRRRINMIKLYNRLSIMDDTRLPKRLLLYNIDMMNITRNWCSEMSDLLHDLESQSDVRNVQPLDVDVLRRKLINKQVSNWDDIRYGKLKLRNYNLFKSDMEAEVYVNFSLDKHTRSLYAQFRAGILPLTMEIGRYYGIPVEERFCPSCIVNNENFVEDEFHFLCKCAQYNELRKVLYEKVNETCDTFKEMDDFDKFIYLNVNSQILTSKFVCNAWKIRQASLYKANSAVNN